jgi:hypothetical protein
VIPISAHERLYIVIFILVATGTRNLRDGYNLTAAAGEAGRRIKVFSNTVRYGTLAAQPRQGLRLKVKPGIGHYDVSVFSLWGTELETAPESVR